MQCTQFEEIIEQHSDEPLPYEATDHLDACSSCRLLWSDLEAIRTASRELGGEEPVPTRVWVAVRSQLESEGLIRDLVPTASVLDWLRLALTPRLAGAALTVLAAALLLGYSGRPSDNALTVTSNAFAPSDAPAGEPELREQLDGDLQRVLAALPDRDPMLVSSLKQNLGIVDNLIDVCEQSVREQPDNPVAREYLYGAYQQKAILLATAMDRSSLEVQ